jgi:hypothetical protein
LTGEDDVRVFDVGVVFLDYPEEALVGTAIDPVRKLFESVSAFYDNGLPLGFHLNFLRAGPHVNRARAFH